MSLIQALILVTSTLIGSKQASDPRFCLPNVFRCFLRKRVEADENDTEEDNIRKHQYDNGNTSPLHRKDTFNTAESLSWRESSHARGIGHRGSIRSSSLRPTLNKQALNVDLDTVSDADLY